MHVSRRRFFDFIGGFVTLVVGWKGLRPPRRGAPQEARIVVVDGWILDTRDRGNTKT